MYDPLAYPLIYPYGNGVWYCKLKHNDLKGKSLKASALKFYSPLLYQRTCDFKILIPCCGAFSTVPVWNVCQSGNRKTFIVATQSIELRARDYTHLRELLADAATSKNQIKEWKVITNEIICWRKEGLLFCRPSILRVINVCGRKCTMLWPYRILLDVQIFLLQWLTIRTGQRYRMRYLRIREQTIDQICVIVCFALSWSFFWSIWKAIDPSDQLLRLCLLLNFKRGVSSTRI